jgi:hypothetical protein
MADPKKEPTPEEKAATDKAIADAKAIAMESANVNPQFTSAATSNAPGGGEGPSPSNTDGSAADPTLTGVKAFAAATQDPGDLPAVHYRALSLDDVMRMPEEGDPQESTYYDNRWKVGPGHSLLGGWVEGQEVPVHRLSALLPKDDAEKAAALERLITIGAIVPMADHEPRGGTASGPLDFINVDPEVVASGQTQARPKVQGQIDALMQRVAGTPTEAEAAKQRPAPKVPTRG